MDEVKGYVKLSKEHLESGRILLESGQYRSSISSSYYAMFSMAKALLIQEGVETSKHSGVTSFFGQYIVKGKGFDKRIYKYLTRAQTSRTQADYDFEYVLNKEDAEEIYEHALIFIQEAEKFL